VARTIKPLRRILRYMRPNKNSFTLIEITTAMFLTAILVGSLTIVFNTGIKAYRQGKDIMEIARKAQLILGQMTKELSAAMVQEDYIPFEGSSSYVYFMAPVENSSDLDLCELGYYFDSANTEIDRHFITSGSGYFEYPASIETYTRITSEPTFCEDVTALSLQYYNGSTSGWQSTWTSTDDNTNNLPQMVSVTVTIQGKYGNPPQTRTFSTYIYLPNSTGNT